MGCSAPQSGQRVTSNRDEQCGHAARVWKVSNGCPQCAHFQYSPTGGAILHVGQRNSSRRGNFAKRESACACLNPLQQLIRIKKQIAPNQTDWTLIAIKTNPTTPSRPMIVAPSNYGHAPARTRVANEESGRHPGDRLAE